MSDNLLNLYLNDNKKKTFNYIINFIELILNKKTKPVLTEDWEIVQKNIHGIILYSNKKELLMEVKKSIDIVNKNEEYIINITPSRDKGYKQLELTFDKNNFTQYEITQFWFNAMPPTILFKKNSYFIPEAQSLSYFLMAFKLDQYFKNLINVSDQEHYSLKSITETLTEKISFIKDNCNKDYLEWKNLDKHIKIINKENSLLFYIANREQIHQNLHKIDQLNPNLIINDKKIIAYDKYLYNFISEIELLYEKCLNKQLSCNDKTTSISKKMVL